MSQSSHSQLHNSKGGEEEKLRLEQDLKRSQQAKRVKMMIIDNLLNFVSSNLDTKLNQIEGLVEKNKRCLKKAQANYDKVEKKVLAYKVSQKGGDIHDSIKCYFEMIKKTGIQFNEMNLQRATDELQEVELIPTADIEGNQTMDSDKTYSELNN